MLPGFPHKYLFKEVSEGTRVFKFKRGICKHWGCRREARSGRRDCNTCKSRKQRLNNPTYYAWTCLEASARKRGIKFLITFAEFKNFCRGTGYLENKGKKSESLTIDRIDPAKPYQLDNLRILTWMENCSHSVEGMTDPREPIARAIAKAVDGNESFFSSYFAEASQVLKKVETLQRLARGREEENPF